MSANLRQWCVAVLAAVVLAAAVAPWLGTGAAAAQSSASFDERVVYERTGGVANVTVQADAPATVHVGSENDAFELRVRVGKGTTRLRLNTYKAGDADRYPLSEMVWAAEGSVQSRTLLSDPIDAPLDPAQYDMNVSVDGVEQDLATLWIQERTTDGMSARIAPRATKVEELSADEDVTEATVSPWNDSVARDDWLLLHVEATGVKGYLGVAGEMDASRLDPGDGVMGLKFVQTNPPMNGQGNEFTGDEVERLFTHADTDGFYAAVDTGEHDVDPGDKYRISFVVPEESPLADAEQRVSTKIRVVERRVDLKRNGPGQTIVVDGETTISGKTTLTPGSTINLTARDPGVAPLFEPRTVTVGGDRSFSASFDFSGLDPGREFEFRLRDQNRVVPAVVAGATTTEPATTETTATETTTVPPTTATPDPTTTVPKTTASPDPTTTDPPPTTTTAEGLTQAALDPTDRVHTQQAVPAETTEGGDGPVPGFGPVAAVLALVAGLLLAARRL